MILLQLSLRKKSKLVTNSLVEWEVCFLWRNAKPGVSEKSWILCYFSKLCQFSYFGIILLNLKWFVMFQMWIIFSWYIEASSKSIDAILISSFKFNYLYFIILGVVFWLPQIKVHIDMVILLPPSINLFSFYLFTTFFYFTTFPKDSWRLNNSLTTT